MRNVIIMCMAIMILSFVLAQNANARPGGLPALTINESIKDCGCPPCCSDNDSKSVAPSDSDKEIIMISLNVEFDIDKYDIRDGYNQDIKRVADFMTQYPEAVAVIEGHTDNTGDFDYNQKLSEKRAESIRQYLIEKFGIESARLRAAGYGETNPIAANDTEDGRQKNRRVEAFIELMRSK